MRAKTVPVRRLARDYPIVTSSTIGPVPRTGHGGDATISSLLSIYSPQGRWRETLGANLR